jgi:hypothetical protein
VNASVQKKHKQQVHSSGEATDGFFSNINVAGTKMMENGNLCLII